MTRLIPVNFKTLLRKLRIGEHFEFFYSGIINGLATLITTYATPNSMYNALKTAFQREDAYYKQSQASTLTPELAAFHEQRIGLFVFFWNYVSAFKYLGDAAKTLAAEKLQFLRNNYKATTSVGYLETSGMLTNFLEDCQKNEWKTLIQLLGLMFIIDKMTEANTSFQGLYVERSTDKEQIADIGKWDEIRFDVNGAFEAMIEAINIEWRANELGAKDQAIRTNLNNIKDVVAGAIHQAELTLARRGHKKTTDDGASDEGTQTPDTTNPPAPDTPPQAPDTTNPPA
ncbi:MAG: DUF6261 family protein, partial [Tannerellaceae bacterium]|nr:DUF6261 family protein [Tannerellaceae bacterium]